MIQASIKQAERKCSRYKIDAQTLMITEHHEISSDNSIQVHDFDTIQTLES
jgi:hypothetical protein